MVTVEETIKPTVSIMLSTGEETCLIKLCCLKNEMLIDDSHVIELQGIHDQVIKTLGKQY